MIIRSMFLVFLFAVASLSYANDAETETEAESAETELVEPAAESAQQLGSSGGNSCEINRQCGTCSVSCPSNMIAKCKAGKYKMNAFGQGSCTSQASCRCVKP